jgi:hypothetical protein
MYNYFIIFSIIIKIMLLFKKAIVFYKLHINFAYVLTANENITTTILTIVVTFCFYLP